MRPDVIKNDARKIPLADNCVDFVFIDSPYSDNIKYSDNKNCIGKISCEKTEFYDELEKVAKEIHRILKQDKVVAWLIGDQWLKKKFTPTGFLLYQRLEKYFITIDTICVTRHNQTSNTGLWHNRARQFNFYLRGFKYLFIMQQKQRNRYCNWRNSLIFSSAKVHTRIAVFDTSGAGNYQYPIRAQQVDSFEVKV